MAHELIDFTSLEPTSVVKAAGGGAPATPAATAAAMRQSDPARDAQRAALRQLVELSEKSADAEAELVARHAAGTSATDKQLTFASTDAEQRYTAAAAAAEQEHAKAVAAANAAHQAEVRKLDDQLAALRRKIDHEKSQVDTDVKKKYEQIAFLAEGVLDSTQLKVASEHKAAIERLNAQAEALNGMEQRAAQLLATYGVSVPAAPAEPAAGTAPPDVTPADAEAKLEAVRAEAEAKLNAMNNLKAPRLLLGSRPYLIGFVLAVLAGAGAQLASHREWTDPAWPMVGGAAGGAIVLTIVLAIFLKVIGRKQVAAAYGELVEQLVKGRAIAGVQEKFIARQRDDESAEAQLKYKSEVQATKEKLLPASQQASKKRDAAVLAAKQKHAEAKVRLDAARAAAHQAAAAAKERAAAAAAASHASVRDTLAGGRAAAIAANDLAFEQGKAELQKQWQSRLAEIQHSIEATHADGPPNGNDQADKAIQRVRFGEIRVELSQVAQRVPKGLDLPPAFALPAVLAYPDAGSLMVHTDRAGRAEAIATLQSVMLKLLTTLPPGRVRFTLIDPVGLGQSFSAFMHLADHDEALVGGRIWTESEQIDQRMIDLSEHMQTVIQKYLRNEYPTIDAYNAQAGELAEPYRFLVIADLPTGFNEESMRRLAAIASTGARCGVFVLIARDTKSPLPSGARLDQIEHHCVNLIRKDDAFVWDDEVFSKFPLTLDPPPGPEQLTKLLEEAGRKAKAAKRVEVSFDNIAPPVDLFWTRSTASEVDIPVGRAGATRLQSLKLGKGVAQHVIIAGKTGSGKSTMLNGAITNAAMWYSPDEIQLYLIDFKKGVEFKAYADHRLPHARAVAVESDREFGLSVLQKLDQELAERGETYRKAGVQDLPSFRRDKPGVKMPRLLLIIDEFQEFFTEDDKIAQEASLLLDRLVRQGRAFGIHVILGSQTIGGSSGLGRSTIGQMAVRVALMTSEADSQIILGDNNSAARLLSRPGEAIYNDQGGLVEANSPFQVAWLPDDRREAFLNAVRAKADKQGGYEEPGVVFEGNAPADLSQNKPLLALLDQKPTAVPSVARAWLGDPVAIKDPTALLVRRQSGANLLVVGQQEEQATALVAAAIVSLAPQYPPKGCKFYLLDGTAAGSSVEGVLPGLLDKLPVDHQNVDWRSANDAINEVYTEMQKRLAGESEEGGTPPSIFLVVHGLQRYRQLRKSEESFSFSMDDAGGEKKPQPDKQFAEMLREGPTVGVHVIGWADTAATIDRTLDRQSLREFDFRVLLQMSSNDSTALIDSPAANKLGFFRAIAFSEEQGASEKFRPYGLPQPVFVAEVVKRLSTRR